MNKLIISAPFGNYIRHPLATSTLGTFTLAYRGGFWYRVWRCLRTLRYYRRLGGWVNKLGLPNPGIHAMTDECSDNIVSIHGFDRSEWVYLADVVSRRRPLAVELNLSCPNVAHSPAVADVARAVQILYEDGVPIIAKLPPVRWLDWARPLHDLGVRTFHCCNTIPTPGGGLSGKTLQQYSLWAVDDMRRTFGHSVQLIGGGGVSEPADVVRFLEAGADHVAVGSALLRLTGKRRLLDRLVAAFTRKET